MCLDTNLSAFRGICWAHHEQCLELQCWRFPGHMGMSGLTNTWTVLPRGHINALLAVDLHHPKQQSLSKNVYTRAKGGLLVEDGGSCASLWALWLTRQQPGSHGWGCWYQGAGPWDWADSTGGFSAPVLNARFSTVHSIFLWALKIGTNFLSLSKSLLCSDNRLEERQKNTMEEEKGPICSFELLLRSHLLGNLPWEAAAPLFAKKL